MGILKWLHISDFHFGKDEYDEQVLCKMIIINLKELFEKGEYIDAIFVTGDITYKGISSQYDAFETFLLEIQEIYLNKNYPRIYIVPGNHDVNRNKNSMIQDSLYCYKNKNAYSMLLDPTPKGLELRNQIFPRFKGFFDTFKDSLCFSVKDLFGEKGFFVDSITNGVSVGISGINTAWLSWSDNDKEHITPGTRIIKEAISALSKYDYKILLGHHPLSWFQPKDYNTISSLLAKYKVIYMYGHIHKNEAGYQIGTSGHEFMHFGAGAAFLTRDTDYLRHSIQYGELDEDGIKIHPQRWSEEQNEWILDSPEYFPKSNQVSGKDYWFFPFSALNSSTKIKRPSSLGKEWVLIDKSFVELRENKKPSDEEMLMFFDGRYPEYSFVFSSIIPIRKKATEFANDYLISEKNKKSKCMLITGAGGEGKTTLALQIICKLAKQDWIILHCADPSKTTSIELSDLEAYNRPLLIVIDNASMIAKNMYEFLNYAKQNDRIVHLLFISVLSDWLNSKAIELQWKGISDYSSFTLSGIERDEAEDIVKAWNQYGDAGLGALSECTSLDIAAEQLYQASKDVPTKSIMDGALLGAIIKTRYRDEYYKCGTYKSLSKKACTMHSIKSTRLEAAVLYAIQQQAYLAVSYSDMIARINMAPLKKSKSVRLNDLIAAKEKELAKIMRYKQALYQDWKDGEITHNDYRHMSEDYEQQVEAAQTVLGNLQMEQSELEKGVDTENPFLAAFRKYENIDKLTREILIELVDYIKVYEGGDISIRFKFADEYRRVTEYIEANTHAEAI